MKVFLIIVAVLAVIIIAILSLSATVTLVYDKGWHTKIQILFIEKDIVLSKILSFVLFPEKKAEEVAKESKNKKNSKKDKKNKETQTPIEKVSATFVNKSSIPTMPCVSQIFLSGLGFIGCSLFLGVYIFTHFML